MSEVRLVVREAERDWSGTIHGSCADRAIAALGADPVTLEELESATERFATRLPGRRFYSNLSPGLCAEPYDAGLVVIDLVARMIVADSTYSSASRDGRVEYHNGKVCTQKTLPYHLSDDWLISNDGVHWKAQADARRRERAAKPVRDAREVFYGGPLSEFVARECFAAFARREEIAAAVRAEWVERGRARRAADVDDLFDDDPFDDDPFDDTEADQPTDEEIVAKTWPGQERYASLFYDTLKQIHVAWMLTPRDDLGGACPREIALERHRDVDCDLQHQCEHWSKLEQRPPILSRTSHAFLYGGFGTQELVVYYDLVRELLWSCWGRLIELSQSSRFSERPESFAAGDFLTSEVPRLEAVREAWLDALNDDLGGTPRLLILNERQRLPEASSGREGMIDPDCPCCQMLADLPGVGFWHLDGCNQDDEFAFDTFCLTREEWEEEHRSREEFHRQCDAKWAERKRLGVTDSMSRADGSNAHWSRSFSVGDTADVPLGIRVFGIGGHLAELIADLRDGADREALSPEPERQIDQLNRDFGNLREVLLSSESSLAEALIDPVRRGFAETLDTVATVRPDLVEKCDSLKHALERLLNPPPPERDWSNAPDDPEVPF